MKRQESIDTVLGKASQELIKIRSDYQDLLPTESVTIEFRLQVGDYLQHLRQVLDYLGNEIYEGYEHSLKKEAEKKEQDKGREILPFFPFAKAKDNREVFEGKLRRWFPGLDFANPSLFELLSVAQHYSGNWWLTEFHKISNKSKHVDIQEQSFCEFLCSALPLPLSTGAFLDIKRGGGQLNFRSARGLIRIRGPQRIVCEGQGTLEGTGQPVGRYRWLDFTIGSESIPVLDLAEDARSYVDDIYLNVLRLL